MQTARLSCSRFGLPLGVPRGPLVVPEVAVDAAVGADDEQVDAIWRTRDGRDDRAERFFVVRSPVRVWLSAGVLRHGDRRASRRP
jgi:hypothetical protein